MRMSAICASTSATAIIALMAPLTAAASEADGETTNSDIVVIASLLDKMGSATTSSEGSITRQEIVQRPAYRVGQYLESIPGLAVTVHSGEGKANQYLLRGFNLDHGTDFATYVDGMPINQRTHAHGQGYTDLNFLMPEVLGGIDFTKGSYFASEGDFSAVGTAHLKLRNRMPLTASASIGDVGDRRLFLGGSMPMGVGTLLAAGEIFRLVGPWDNPDNLRRLNTVVRWNAGSVTDGFSLTAMYYTGRWNATTDQPLRAVQSGLIGRFGSLDPSDGGRSRRTSLSLHLAKPLAECDLTLDVYGVHQRLTLWSNFTHFLAEPVRGDQAAQNDSRWIFGGDVAVRRTFTIGATEHTVTFGLQPRLDWIDVDLQSTQARQSFATLRSNTVEEFSVGGFMEHKARWTPWLRTVLGVREDYYRTDDLNELTGERGKQSEALFQPKASLVLGPWKKTELYFSAGRGFHSNDARSGQVEDDLGNISFVRPPLIVRSSSYEIGLRSNLVSNLTVSVTAFKTVFESELIYVADAGQTEAGRPSHRRGIEFSAQYRPFSWIELNSNIAISRARYTDGDPKNRHVEDAPRFIGAAGVLIDNLGPWSGSLAWRKLGAHPLADDGSITSPGYSEVNISLGYKFGQGISARLDIYNLLQSTDNAADYFYASRLVGEAAEGVEGLHSHPLEPRSFRLTLSVEL